MQWYDTTKHEIVDEIKLIYRRKKASLENYNMEILFNIAHIISTPLQYIYRVASNLFLGGHSKNNKSHNNLSYTIGRSIQN